MSRPPQPFDPTRAIGVDTGGTFTDLARVEGERVRTVKLPSTPDDPSRAVLAAIEHASEAPGTELESHVVHGTTVALNALLTGSTARAALVTNAGFRDLVEIGRQDRPELYALHPRKPRALVPRELRFEVGQRTWPDPESGRPKEVARPGPDELVALVRKLARARPQSVCVCLLHSYADPTIERRVARALRPLGVPITCSADLLREYREYERFSTAAVNAALVPVMRAYVSNLAGRLPRARLSILQSAGGSLPAARAAEEPVRVLLSGPAGGVVGAARAAAEAGFERLVGLDMGGTSTDVAFHDRRHGPAVLEEPARVAGHPVGVPSLDIHTIGTGGGSLAEVDSAGVLHVGPQSAGADPGPVCYGRSDRLTVTDAHVLLGHIASGAFLDGELELDTDAVARAFERLARRLGTRPRAAAQSLLDVARASMRRAVGVMTMQRGQDPRDLPLVAFGGAGGLHAGDLARSLGMRAALVPSDPGVLSALGMAHADALRETSTSVLERWGERPWREHARALRAMERELAAELRAEGHRAGAIVYARRLDLRYEGQSFELRVLAGPRADHAFHALHEELYGFRLDRPIELVTLRARAVVPAPAPEARTVRPRRLPAEAVVAERRAGFGRDARVPVVARAALRPGHRFDGPALVEEYSGTTLIPPGQRATVTAGGHLLIE